MWSYKKRILEIERDRAGSKRQRRSGSAFGRRRSHPLSRIVGSAPTGTARHWSLTRRSAEGKPSRPISLVIELFLLEQFTSWRTLAHAVFPLMRCLSCRRRQRSRIRSCLPRAERQVHPDAAPVMAQGDEPVDPRRHLESAGGEEDLALGETDEPIVPIWKGAWLAKGLIRLLAVAAFVLAKHKWSTSPARVSASLGRPAHGENLKRHNRHGAPRKTLVFSKPKRIATGLHSVHESRSQELIPESKTPVSRRIVGLHSPPYLRSVPPALSGFRKT
jgi:hypothetical protein